MQGLGFGDHKASSHIAISAALFHATATVYRNLEVLLESSFGTRRNSEEEDIGPQEWYLFCSRSPQLWTAERRRSSMEPDEIGVVLARASELHAKISEAIERALKAEFLKSRSNSPNNGDAGENTSPTSVAGDSSAEARSLGAIRDALEALEEQLEALQLQKRSEKDAALAELEESRRILLTRLKEHRGKEWEVVHEALAFAGEPVEDNDDLRLPPYLMEDQYSSGRDTLKYNGALRNLSPSVVGQSDGEENAAGGSDAENHDDSTRSYHSRNDSRDGGGLFRIARAIFEHACGLTTKVAIVAACVAAAVALGEVGQSIERKMSSPDSASKEHPPPPPPATKRQACPTGKKLISENGYTKCVVKERVELPFPTEITTPDVFYGRG